MAINSSIEWTDRTWNPVTGCQKISPGCKFCYADRMHKRLQGMGQEKYSTGFNVVRTHESSLSEPYTWKFKDKSKNKVFVNSMSDLFHKDVPLEFIQKVFKTMNETPHIVYQILTKRAERFYELCNKLNWADNIWMGVSVENQDYAYRVDILSQTPAKVKFLSIEPLIGEITNLNLQNIDWVIVGGESGPGSRPMNSKWVKSILAMCKKSKTPFFFKQWGGVRKKETGRLLNGKEYNQFPLEYEKYLKDIKKEVMND